MLANKTKVEEMKNGMSEQLLQQILTELREVKTDVSELKSDMSELKSDVAELKSDVAELKSDVAELKSDVAELKSDVAELKSDVAELKSEQQKTNARLDKIEQDTALIPMIQRAVLETYETVQQLAATQTNFEIKTTSDLNTHEHSIDILNRRQFRLEADLEKVKNR
ncbi:LPP leucine zipper domain-containing protein [Cohnella soli]|uniref:LPP leucine zipper domain-containing protein n=1 Tax=Cohnella soli TaxID=425005 RepID=A0ABW0I1B6_9BACL